MNGAISFGLSPVFLLQEQADQLAMTVHEGRRSFVTENCAARKRAASFSPSLCHFSLSSGSRNSVKCTRDTMLIKTAAVCCLASGGRRTSTRRRSLCWLATQPVRLHLHRPTLDSIRALCCFLFWTLLSLHFSYPHSICPLCVFHYFLIALSHSLSSPMASCPEKVNSTTLWCSQAIWPGLPGSPADWLPWSLPFPSSPPLHT